MIISAKANAREEIVDGLTRMVNGVITDSSIERETTDIDKYIKDFGVIQEFHIVARNIDQQSTQVEPVICHVRFRKQDGQDRSAIQAAIAVETDDSFTLRFALRRLEFETTMPIAKIVHKEEKIFEAKGEVKDNSREALVAAFKAMAAGDSTGVEKILAESTCEAVNRQLAEKIRQHLNSLDMEKLIAKSMGVPADMMTTTKEEVK